jgi:hypothetical protein
VRLRLGSSPAIRRPARRGCQLTAGSRGQPSNHEHFDVTSKSQLTCLPLRRESTTSKLNNSGKASVTRSRDWRTRRVSGVPTGRNHSSSARNRPRPIAAKASLSTSRVLPTSARAASARARESSDGYILANSSAWPRASRAVPHARLARMARPTSSSAPDSTLKCTSEPANPHWKNSAAVPPTMRPSGCARRRSTLIQPAAGFNRPQDRCGSSRIVKPYVARTCGVAGAETHG